MRIAACWAVSFLAMQIGTAQAAFVIDRSFTDASFNAACGGTDSFGCEYTVAEGRAGNRATDGAFELQNFDRSVPGNIPNFTAQTAAGQNFSAANPFTLSYNGSTTLSLSYLGSSYNATVPNFGTPFATGSDNPDGPASALVIRVRDANLSNLAFNGDPVDTGLLTGIAGNVAYLAFSGASFTSAWTLTGSALLGTGTNSGSAFQVKVTDLNVVPLPAAALLFGSGLLGLGILRHRARAAA